MTGDVASDVYHRYEEDIRMLAKGNQNAYRFSLCWTRILPNGTGVVSQEAVSYTHLVGENLDETDIKASYDNGELKVTFPKETVKIPEKKTIMIE